MTSPARSLWPMFLVPWLAGCGLGPLDDAERERLARTIETEWPQLERGEGTISVEGEKLPGDRFDRAVREAFGDRRSIRLLTAIRTARSEHSPRELEATFEVEYERGTLEVRMHTHGDDADAMKRLGELSVRRPDWTVSRCEPCSIVSFDRSRSVCPTCERPWTRRTPPRATPGSR